jgi:sugar lactone lactonase YvrE
VKPADKRVIDRTFLSATWTMKSRAKSRGGCIAASDPESDSELQIFINRAGPSEGSAAGLAFSPDSAQQFLFVADYGNSRVVVVDRKGMRVLYQFGNRSATPGDFQGPHHLAVDSKGNIYTAEVAPGNRAQRFVYKGMSATPPPNALTPAQLTASK